MVFVSQNNIHIDDSYLIRRRKEIYEYLEALKRKYPYSDVWNRSMFHLSCEWRAHNRLYMLGLFKDHTKDVDLDYPQKWYYKVLYFILGI